MEETGPQKVPGGMTKGELGIAVAISSVEAAVGEAAAAAAVVKDISTRGSNGGEIRGNRQQGESVVAEKVTRLQPAPEIGVSRAADYSSGV